MSSTTHPSNSGSAPTAHTMYIIYACFYTHTHTMQKKKITYVFVVTRCLPEQEQTKNHFLVGIEGRRRK
jgi:hypothetical protein